MYIPSILSKIPDQTDRLLFSYHNIWVAVQTGQPGGRLIIFDRDFTLWSREWHFFQFQFIFPFYFYKYLPFLLGLYYHTLFLFEPIFPFFIKIFVSLFSWTIIILFYLDCYFPFLFGLLFPFSFWTFISFFYWFLFFF